MQDYMLNVQMSDGVHENAVNEYVQFPLNWLYSVPNMKKIWMSLVNKLVLFVSTTETSL